MHLHFERIEKPHSFSDCNILSLSWMGKVPDGLLQSQDEEGWKLNRTNYYQDGWIALGNSRGIVGVTYTTCRCRKAPVSELPSRTNYNLRGHRSEVTLVKWNEPYQKLASCDASGIIFVWIKYEGRWSVELINDRNTQVTDFSWSHDGRMALICYIDGFVLIGSVAGQRYWSSMLNLDSCSTTCGIWTPDDQQVIFGTSNGSILVIDIVGTIVAQLSIREGHSISSMAWSSEKFKMEDIEDDSTAATTATANGNASGTSKTSSSGGSGSSRTYVLAICFDDGVLYLLKSYDDIFPVIIRTNLSAIKMEWSNKGEILAVAGHQAVDWGKDSGVSSASSSNTSFLGQSSTSSSANQSIRYVNMIQFYSESGCLRYQVTLDYTAHPIGSLTWGHNDKRLFVGTGPVLHIAWVTKRVASLHLLCRLVIYKTLSSELSVESLPLPFTLKNLVASLFGRTLRCYLPDNCNLTRFVVNPPTGNVRLYCTLIRHDDDIIGSSSSYVLYLEYLGGLVPILKGKRTSKFRPEFVIYDPQVKMIDKISNNSYNGDNSSGSNISFSGKGNDGKRYQPTNLYWHSSSTPGTSDSESEDLVASRIRKKRRQHRSRRHYHEGENEINGLNRSLGGHVKPESTYMDAMPEIEKLTLVTSNIWGTKFKIIGLASWLPAHLGSVAYRTSLLHLQPRQMTLKIKELGGQREGTIFDEPAKGQTSDKSVTVTSSEDEDDGSSGGLHDEEYGIPVAPITPKKTFRCQSQNSTISPHQSGATSNFLRSTNFSSSGQNESLGSDYVNLISNLSEDLLTLQVNGTPNGQHHVVSMEMVPASSSSSHFSTCGQQQQQHQQHSLSSGFSQLTTANQPSSNSISTQTSFQSLSDLNSNCLASDRPVRPIPPSSLSTTKTTKPAKISTSESPKTICSPAGLEEERETRTEETFSMMARKFSADLPCTSKTPASQSLVFNRYELFQPILMCNSSNSFNGSVGCKSPPPTSSTPSNQVSPPAKGFRYSKRSNSSTKSRETARKGLIQTDSGNSANGDVYRTLSTSSSSNNCDSASGCYKCSKGAARCGYGLPTSPTTGSSSNWFPPSSIFQYSNGIASASGLCLNGTASSCLSGVDSCLVEQRHVHPSSTSHDIKYIDDIDVESEIGPELTTSSTFGRSPSLLFYRNRSSIAQFQSNPSSASAPSYGTHSAHNHLHHNYNHSHHYHGAQHTNPILHHHADFTNIRVAPGEQSSASQRRYILSTCKNNQSDESDDNLTGKSARNCMSLDEEIEEGGKSIPSSATFCKCNEESDNKDNCGVKTSDNESSSSKLPTIEHNHSSIISSPVHVARRKFLIFDSEELLNSLNDCNSLLTETYSLVRRDESRNSLTGQGTLASVGGSGPGRTGHRGSLPQAVIPENGSLSKSIRSELINRSLPTSPMLGSRNRRKAQGKSIFYSPTMFRKVMKQKLNYLDCSSDDDNSSDDEYRSQDFRNLGSFQRSNMKKKIKVKRRSSRVQPDENVNQRHSDGREFLLHNKAPLWNEVSQVYQLDFGGRVTQESAKNFQIEHQGKQVMQFGRIDDNAYTLDFQYPFSALQALAVALANVTQRLK